MDKKEFLKLHKKFRKKVKKHGTQFFGLGCFPTDKHGYFDKEVGELLQRLLEYEPYLNMIRESFGLLEEEEDDDQ